MPGFPSLIPRPAIRLNGASPGLAVGVAFGNTDVRSELVATAGSARIRVRILTASAGGTIQIIPMATDGTTEHTTGASAATAVVAGTEMNVDLDLYGENLCKIEFVGGGTGTITYVEIAQV